MGTGANDENPQMALRYYQGYLDFITGLNPGSQFTLVTAPEPCPPYVTERHDRYLIF